MYRDICAIFKTNDFVKMNIFATEHIDRHGIFTPLGDVVQTDNNNTDFVWRLNTEMTVQN